MIEVSPQVLLWLLLVQVVVGGLAWSFYLRQQLELEGAAPPHEEAPARLEPLPRGRAWQITEPGEPCFEGEGDELPRSREAAVTLELPPPLPRPRAG